MVSSNELFQVVIHHDPNGFDHENIDRRCKLCNYLREHLPRHCNFCYPDQSHETKASSEVHYLVLYNEESNF